MHAMQYRITLPADYDMTIIRRRVRTKGHLLDDFPGLGLKAYGIRERGVDGSPVNAYAPFYLWTSTEAMNGFLWGPGFRGLSHDFGRPTVENWLGLGFARGPATAAAPGFFSRRAEPVPAGTDPDAAVERALEELEHRAAADGVHCAAVGIDPHRWELLHFTLWADAAPTADGELYQVLHLSAPHLDELPRGRGW
ncbi:DUF4865 family protein [Streptomyces sp. LX-29]|uniref:DUF4865 family protein n=1 Tax=Streptomyces sp. LX-29 TaxID=2900152 RepID=UPI00240D8F97|nr:DUF4865 family protein [Streptomyces sp. LX-29]WFB06401.1 DUF4865 family protein [Streptomyces sp. LX-29]